MSRWVKVDDGPNWFGIIIIGAVLLWIASRALFVFLLLLPVMFVFWFVGQLRNGESAGRVVAKILAFGIILAIYWVVHR